MAGTTPPPRKSPRKQAGKQSAKKPSKTPRKKTSANPEPRTRRDGFTAVRKQKFLGALGRTGCVRDACRVAGISSTTAYRHAKKDPEFRAAWDRAHARSLETLEAAAFQRAVEGVDEPVVHGGKVVTTRKKYSDPLLRDLIVRATEAAARVAEAERAGNNDILTREEWEDGISFGVDGQKGPVSELISPSRIELFKKLETMRRRSGAPPPPGKTSWLDNLNDVERASMEDRD